MMHSLLNLAAALLFSSLIWFPVIVSSTEAANPGVCDVFADGTLDSGDELSGQISALDVFGNATGFWQNTVPSRALIRCERRLRIVESRPETPWRNDRIARLRAICERIAASDFFESDFFGGQVTTAFCVGNGVAVVDVFGFSTWIGLQAAPIIN